MSYKFYNNIIHQYKNLMDGTFGVINNKYIVISCTDEILVDKYMGFLEDLVMENNPVVFRNKVCYRGFFIRGKLNFIMFAEGETETISKNLAFIGISVLNLKLFEEERYDKTNFVKSILFDSILPGDIYIKAKELKIPADIKRMVFGIRLKRADDGTAFDILNNLFPKSANKDFVVKVDEYNIVVVKEVPDEEYQKESVKIAKSILDTLSTEALNKATIGIGTKIGTLRELSSSYRESQISLEVGKVFDTEKPYISYEQLGIGRLIYQLPVKLCQMFLDEVFKNQSFEQLDSEMINTIQGFFANNLNISETARQLYIHRNTLVYRLDKIQKITKLDLRSFEEAIIFKVGMMVKRYLLSNPMQF